ncbi:MAG: FkbM family methyltransferase [Sphingomonadaceae bacterium]
MLYKSARGDVPNDMMTNGELKLVAHVVDAMAEGLTPTIALDVGANRGEWSREVLDQSVRYGLEGVRVLAFEPVPATTEQLRANIGEREGVTIIDRALGERRGTARMAVSNDVHSSGGTNALIMREGFAGNDEEIEVLLDTLTSIFDEFGIDRAAIVKCDAEGFDPFVIDGARPLLDQGRIDILQFEYNHRWVGTRRFLQDIFAISEETPYAVCGITPNGLERFESWHFELESFFERNYALIHKDAANWLPIHFGRFDATNSYA